MDQAISQGTLLQRRRKMILLILAGLIVVMLAAWMLNRVVSPGVSLGEIRVAQVRVGAVDNTINASGVVIPVHEEQLSSPNQSRISKVIAKAGQQVRAGELLMVLDDHTIRLAIDNLREQISQQQIREQVLAMEMDAGLKKIASEIELMELDLQSNQVKLARYQKLGPVGITSAVDLQAAELAVKRNEVQLRQHKETLTDTRRTTSSNIEAARLQKSIFQKQMELQQRLLEQTQVKAPFDGLLTWLLAEEGASLNTGQLIAKVSELSNFKVEATVSDFYARYLNAGQKVRVEYSGQILNGEVQTILPEIQNGTVKLIVTLAQPNHPALRHRLRVEANIITEQKARSLIVDSGPAINGKGRQDVYMLEAGRAVRKSVEIGLGDSKVVEVVQGAKAGDQLVISDVSQFRHLESFRVTQ
ncbi:HlyD family efflux transporter periplasmic adaptor subunit [Undibacterium sp. CY18W]|uniref:HlyD family efflux transporter periplasmic adaptor subunit n=1 Tax=Undibacterium hunanense TaxID=2762292 RepID=A0ABR6ZLT9_9BURK|nr:HlyD family efflux transporter periplasmic adaptor subunit [Undibacterium hunanense]MBC3916870.1 HlyD family efflux transporter periplasmic adaptor subunit [Undibacterium hunanense]